MIIVLCSNEETANNKYPIRKYCLDISQIDFWCEFSESSFPPQRLQIHFRSGLNVGLIMSDWDIENWNELIDALGDRWYIESGKAKEEEE